MFAARLVLATGLAVAIAAPAFATTPDGPYWTELPLPATFGGPVKCLGHMVMFQAANDVHIWSAITRDWTVVPTSGGAVVSMFNEHVIIQDGLVTHGYSNRTGAVDTLTLGAAPSVQSGPATSSWMSIAALGNDVWGFGAFDGKWVHQALANAGPTISVAQVTGVVYDGAVAYGFSAYHGQFVPTPVMNATTVSASGEVALANDGTTVRGFSSQHNTWSVSAFVNTTPQTLQRSYALFVNGADVLAFSGLTGSFTSFTAANAGFAVAVDTNVAVLVDGGVVSCYAASVNTFSTAALTSPSFVLQDDFALVSDPNGVLAFSGITGQFAPQLSGAFSFVTNEAAAWGVGPNGSFAYSLLKNDWFGAPTTPTNIAVLRNCVVIADGSGWYGFSGRGDTWAYQASTTPSNFVANASGDVFVGMEPAQLHLFDPVLQRWDSITTQGPVGIDTWRQCAVASDGVNAYGAGLMNNTWDEIPLQGSLVSFDANDSSGFVLTDSHLYTYTAHGSFTSWSRWPEFTRFQVIGADMHLVQTAPAGSAVMTFVGLGPAFVPAGGYGTLMVGPTVALTFNLGVVPAGDKLDVTVPVPNLPILNGLAVHMQNVVFAPLGAVWLTNAIAPVLL